jgi:hypothetical protein
MNEFLVPNARPYAARYQLEFAETLGSGKDGIVVVARYKTKPSDVALKFFRFKDAYRREKHAYQRLEAFGVSRILDFNVPQLLRFDDELQVLEMTIVKRPFILDFAGAYLVGAPNSPLRCGRSGKRKSGSSSKHIGQRSKRPFQNSKGCAFIYWMCRQPTFHFWNEHCLISSHRSLASFTNPPFSAIRA